MGGDLTVLQHEADFDRSSLTWTFCDETPHLKLDTTPRLPATEATAPATVQDAALQLLKTYLDRFVRRMEMYRDIEQELPREVIETVRVT